MRTKASLKIIVVAFQVIEKKFHSYHPGTFYVLRIMFHVFQFQVSLVMINECQIVYHSAEIPDRWNIVSSFKYWPVVLVGHTYVGMYVCAVCNRRRSKLNIIDII